MTDRACFRAKRDVWLTLAMWGASALVLWGALVLLRRAPGSPPHVAVALVLGGAAGIMLWTLHGTKYVVGPGALRVHSGPLRYTIPIGSIRAIHASRSALSGRATALDRFELELDSGSVSLSPADARGFLDALHAAGGPAVSRDPA